MAFLLTIFSEDEQVSVMGSLAFQKFIAKVNSQFFYCIERTLDSW